MIRCILNSYCNIDKEHILAEVKQGFGNLKSDVSCIVSQFIQCCIIMITGFIDQYRLTACGLSYISVLIVYSYSIYISPFKVFGVLNLDINNQAFVILGYP